MGGGGHLQHIEPNVELVVGLRQCNCFSEWHDVPGLDQRSSIYRRHLYITMTVAFFVARRFTMFVSYVLRALACLALVGAVCAGAAQSPFSLTIQDQLYGPTVKLGSHVELKLTLTNTSASGITFWDRNRLCDYQLDIRDGSGRPVPETSFKSELKCGSGFRVAFGKNQIRALKPSESFTDVIFIDEAYELSHPDKYTIQASRAIPPELGRGSVRSNIITIAVTDK
jgi:hypothetical protein